MIILNNMDTNWKEILTKEQYNILREKGTELPFSGKYLNNKEKGIYKCMGCGEPLFSDEMKFESECGWPSFDKEIPTAKIIKTLDLSHGLHRIEISCSKCKSHLGHIFEDGPTETGNRYCVNSVSLNFEPIQIENNNLNESDSIILAGGCFWCIEAIFDQLNGVTKVESGYSGGETLNPTYKEVSKGTTNHAEVVRIFFNPKIINLETIIDVFFTVHDPTTLNQQGHDIGTQYRSAIFYYTESQKKIIEKIIYHLEKDNVFDKKIITEVKKYKNFYIAENYHQEYYELNKENPYCNSVISPKIKKFKTLFDKKLKK